MKFQIGERVRYSHAFLKSTGSDLEISRMIGTVQKIFPIQSTKNSLIKVLWDGETEAKGCLASNLSHMNYDITE
jgi:hypothetical protein